MADLLANARTALPPEETVIRAVQFFTNETWRTQSQTSRVATFVGRPKIPWGLLFLTILAFFCFIVPGVIMYFLVIRKIYRFQNIVVTTTPSLEGTEVTITYPKSVAKLVDRFVAALPPVSATAVVGR